MELRVLDLFSGAGGFSKGIEMAGHKITEHYFSEIDKHAIANYLYNFKNAKYYGSVTDVRGKRGEVDIITFGSPCQDFSLAGKRKGMEGERSSLIGEAIRLIDEIRPSVFVWENVKGTFSSNNGADFWAIISSFANIGCYRLEWQLLNTSWFLPQNRERIYLVGHLAERSEPGVFPIGEDSKLFNRTKRKERQESSSLQNKSFLARSLNCGTSSGQGSGDTFVKVKSATKSGYEVATEGDSIKIKSNTKKGYEEAQEGDSINFSVPTSKTRRGRVGKGKAQTLDTSCNQGIIGYSRDSKGKIVNYHKKNIANTLHSSSGSGGNTDQYVSSINIRRLTEIECERLQGFPDDWTKFGIYNGEVKQIPKTQRYKLMGNAVTTEVVAEIFRRIKLKEWQQ
jgi:DNA (cytosine-5)-methyltransferase 1